MASVCLGRGKQSAGVFGLLFSMDMDISAFCLILFVRSLYILWTSGYFGGEFSHVSIRCSSNDEYSLFE